MLQIHIRCPIGGLGAGFIGPVHLLDFLMSRTGLLEEGLGPAPAAQEPETERQANESSIFRKVFTIHLLLLLKKCSIMVISNRANRGEMGKNIITVKYYNIGFLSPPSW
jgi:hypothetical protein